MRITFGLFQCCLSLTTLLFPPLPSVNWSSNLDGPLSPHLAGLHHAGLTFGSHYDVDRGVEPDYPISSYDRYYDREALVEYINSLY